MHPKPTFTGYYRLSGGDEDVRLIRSFSLVGGEEKVFSPTVMWGGSLEEGRRAHAQRTGILASRILDARCGSARLPACMLVKCPELEKETNAGLSVSM